MKAKRGLSVCMATLLMVTCVSCGSVKKERGRVPVLLEDREVEFMTEKVIKKDIQEKLFEEALIFSRKEQWLAFKNPGELMTYDVFIGKEVKKGDVLASINLNRVKEKIEIKELEIEQHQLRLDLAKKTENPIKVKEADLGLRIKQKELLALKKTFENSTLVSELDGIISKCTTKSLGTTVTPGVNIIRILDSKDLAIRFMANESQLEKIKVGDSVELIIEDKKYSSEISEIVNSRVKIRMPDELQGRLRVSTNIKVRKILNTVKNALMVPKTGISTDRNNRSRVQIVRDGMIITRKVKLGIETEDYVQILEGVEEGEDILVK